MFIIHKVGYGGAEKVMTLLANHFVEDNEIYLLTYENSNILQEIDSRINHVKVPDTTLSTFAIKRILQVIKVRRIIKSITPDLIISFLTYPNIISILASIGTGIPVIISERGDPYALNGWFSRFKDFIYNFADGYVFQTNGALNYYNKRIQSKSVVIKNPVDKKIISLPRNEERDDIIVNVARLELRQKRQDLLIKSFSKIAHKYPGLRLILYGDGDDENKIKSMINDAALERQILLAGVTKNLYESIKNAKLFVLSSDYEGIPNALIEAMSIGLPCVSTDCSPGGAAELISHMDNGMLVNRGSVEELAESMEYMLDHSREAERMGRNATRITSNFALDEIIRQWSSFVNNIIENKLEN